jgi:hypothetical protein
MGLGPETVRRQVPDVRWVPVAWWLAGVRKSPDFRHFGSVEVVLDFRRRPVVRSLRTSAYFARVWWCRLSRGARSSGRWEVSVVRSWTDVWPL